MSNDKNEKSPEQIKEEEFFKIHDMQGELIYTTNKEELTDVLVGILSSGSFTKTFSLFKGKIELTYQSITEKERMSGYDLIRLNADKLANNASQIQLDAFNAKVNIFSK